MVRHDDASSTPPSGAPSSPDEYSPINFHHEERDAKNSALAEFFVEGQPRGHHRVLIGASPGVGKTYRMLQEAHHLKRLGVDVVVGYFESHGRAETQALLEGLEVVPREKIHYKSIVLEEMSLLSILLRRPHTVLVDELAHTNVKGSLHEKRFEDVETLLKAGINVISTLNIQHIESLNDIVARITGVSVNERVPDAVMDQANEVVLVDISVEELQERLRRGKIYRPEKIEQALNNFFKKGNLVALRELALREVANTIEEQALTDPVTVPKEITGVHERILVCISAHPTSQRLIRRGFRIADGLSADLMVLYVQLRHRPLQPDYQKHLERHIQLTEELGGEFYMLQANDIVDAVVELAKQKKITQIVVGEGLKDPNFLGRLKPPIPYQIFQKTDHIDVHIIAKDRNL